MSRASGLAGFSTSISPPSNLSVGVITATSLTVGGVTVSSATIPTLRITNTDTTAIANDIAGSVEFFSKDASEPDVVTGYIRNIAEDAGTKYALTFGAKNTGVGAQERLRIDSSGKMGIGTTSPSVNLQVQDDSSFSLIRVVASSGSVAGIDFGDAADTDTAGVRYDNVSDSMAFRVNASERARIDSSGRLLVGTGSDSGGALFQVNGDRIRIGTAKTPATSGATGTTGEIAWDADYIYVCTATNTWKRSAIATW